MAHISCTFLPTLLVENLISPPFEEGKNHLNYAFFQSKVNEEGSSIEGPSLLGRVVHLVEGLIFNDPHCEFGGLCGHAAFHTYSFAKA